MTARFQPARLIDRIARAVKRYGLGRLTTVVAASVSRRGLTSTIGALGRPAFSAGLDLDARRRQSPPGRALNSRYALSAASWNRWMRQLPVSRLIGAGATPTALAVVIGEADAPSSLAAANLGGGVVGSFAVAEVGAAVEALTAAGGGFVLFLEPGDQPVPGLATALGALASDPTVEVVSWNACRAVDGDIQPLFHPGANPTQFEAVDYLFSRFAIRASAMPRPAAASPRDILLTWLKDRTPAQAPAAWRHLNRPMGILAVSDDAIAQRRRDLRASAAPAASSGQVGASVVICTKDKGHLTRQLVRNLLGRPPSLIEEVVIVSNRTTSPHALQTLSDLDLDPRVTVIRHDGPFNFSRLSNLGAAASRGGGPLLFMNDDIVPVSEDWLERLMGHIARPAVGAAGPLLLYPDERVQHAGMYLGFEGAAGHGLRGAVLPDEDYLFTASAPREVSCLTAAVLLTPRAGFQALGGFDEGMATHLQDVDYGLRLIKAGWRNVFEPRAVLIHMESTSVRRLSASADFIDQRLADRQAFEAKWSDVLSGDRFHASGFDPDDETMRTLAPAASLVSIDDLGAAGFGV